MPHHEQKDPKDSTRVPNTHSQIVEQKTRLPKCPSTRDVGACVSLTKLHQYATRKKFGKLRTETKKDQNPTSKVTVLVYMIRQSSQPCTINCRNLIENSNTFIPHVLDVHQYKACVCLDTKLYLILFGGDEDNECACHCNKCFSKDTQKGCEYNCGSKNRVSCGKVLSLYPKTSLPDSIIVSKTQKKYAKISFVIVMVLCLLIVFFIVQWKKIKTWKWSFIKKENLMILNKSEIQNTSEILNEDVIQIKIQNKGEIEREFQNEGVIQREIRNKGEIQRAIQDEGEIQRAIQDECVIQRAIQNECVIQRAVQNEGEIQRAIQDEGEIQRAVQNEGEIQNEGYSEKKVDKKDTWLLNKGWEMIKSVEVFCGNATTIQEPVPARLLGMTKQETNNTARFISPLKSVEIDTSPHFCLLCKDLPTSFGLFLCMQEKYKSNMQKEFSHDVEFIFQYNDSEHKTFEEEDIVTDTNNFIEIHSSRYTTEFTSTENEELNNQKVLIGSLENGFGVKLGNNNRESSGSVSRDIHRSYRLSTHCPVRGYDCNSVRKLRVQVVPNQLLQSEEQCDVKVVQGASSKPWEINQNNDIFFNLKYKVNVEESPKKKIDCTLQEEAFDDTMLLRGITWLPINQLPVPEIDLTVAHLTNFEPIMEIIDLIAAGTPPTPHISMRYELLRFCTLRSYPKEDKPYLIKLAEAGFYYASDGDGVVCYCCGIRRYNWTAEDNPKKIHERINPSCKFLRKNEEVNVPVQYFGPYSKELMAIMEIPEPIERPQVSEDVNNDWAPERIRTPASQQPNRPNESGTNALGINTAIPKHSQYATKTAREASYSTWPDTSSHTPEVLADAGFFYAGFGDCVRCFYCGIGLRHWTAEDDPWIEHARWSKNCVFVKQKKGEEFVNLVQLAVQYSQDNEANPSGQNQLQSQEIERLLLSDAAQSVLEMGYQPRLIKKSIEEILKQNGDTNITAQLLMEKVLEIEESENRSQSAPQATATITSSATVAQATATTTTNTATAVQVKTRTGKPEITKPGESKEAKTKSKAEKKPGKFDASKENKSKEKKEDKGKEDKGKEDKDESQEDPKAIKKENEELKEQTLCKVCLDNTVCIVFLPCGHLVTCADCAPAMRKCPICRALVKGTVRTYMS
ncbi:uncharacterized protein LOC132756601 [Ruditapes philippinarum]|uniref:uncharacterized protein LOC132756601 n=1 Tax=Ruditapes philippinarum TaxID=129788 RepID=UPI00295C0101|nr:uncharacterized protein LOC132756601 [Ruditapes philippinarum]